MTQNTEFTSFSRSDSTSGEEQSSHLAKARDELHVGLDIPKQAATEVYNWVQEQDWPKGTELEPLESYHITMLFAQGDGAGAHKDAKWIKHDSHAVTLKGIKKFPPSDERDGLHPIVLLVKSDTIHGHHNALAEGALEAGADPGPYSRGKFVPHMTVAYAPSLPEDLKLPELTFETAESSVSTPREETAEEESSREYKERHKDDDHEASVFSFVGLAAPEPPQVAPESSVSTPREEKESSWHFAAQLTLEEFEADPNTLWHGTPYGMMGEGPIHIGTKRAAEEALRARMLGHGDYQGKPPGTYWDLGEPIPKEGFKKPWWKGEGEEYHQPPGRNPRLIPVQLGVPASEHIYPDVDVEGDEFGWEEALRHAQEEAIAYRNEGEDAGSISYVVPHRGMLRAHPDAPLDRLASVGSFVFSDIREPPQITPEGTEHESKQEPHPWRIAQPRPPYMAELVKFADSWNPKDRYWHITHDPHFQIDPSRTPSDLSSMSMGADHEPALMFTDDPHGWASAFHSHPDELGVEYENTDPRLYAAEIEPYGQMGATNSEEGDYWPVNRGFGSEYYMPNPSPHVVRRVVPLTQALTEAEPSWNPKSATATGSPGLQKKAEYYGDSWSPKTIWPNALRERNGEPVDADCSCKDGEKLQCPIHGLHPVHPEDRTLEFPNPASPVGYDYHADGPRTWMRAETSYTETDDDRRDHSQSNSGRPDSRELHEDESTDWHFSNDFDPWQRGACGTYAVALKECDPSLKYGIQYGVEDEPEEEHERGWDKAQHVFVHDDKYAYDSMGRHRLPYKSPYGRQTEYDVPEEHVLEHEFVEGPEEREAWQHIQQTHPQFAHQAQERLNEHPSLEDEQRQYEEEKRKRQEFYTRKPYGACKKCKAPLQSNGVCSYNGVTCGMSAKDEAAFWAKHRKKYGHWHFGADKADTREYQDFRMMPPMTQPPNATNPHPEAHGCTCQEGEKLTCPVHGLNPTEQGYDHSWSIPQGHPVGYPQDQPKNYTKASVGDGDGFVTCTQGHNHWGVHGAAGLMLRHVDDEGQARYLLTHRSPNVQHGSTYSVPGGALDSHEYPEEGALREAQEELGPIPGFHPTGVETADHGGWAYHTVHGDVDHMFEPQPQNWETNSAQWFTPQEIDQLLLHPGFRSYWEGRGRTSAWRMVDVSGDQGGEQDDAKANREAKEYVPEQRADDRRKANQDESSRVDVHWRIVARAHPAWLDQWMAQHGPYAYHGSDEDFDAEIARNGLMPWNQIPNYKPGIGQEGELGQPRPNHIYMSTTPPHPEDYSRIYKIDLRKLNPENLNPDEDWYSDAPGAPPINSYTGQGAEDLGLGDDPAHTHTSMEWGKFSHRGPIPPEAISIHEPPREGGDWAMTGLPRAEGAVDDEDEHEDNLEGDGMAVPAPPEQIKKKLKERKDQELVEESARLGVWNRAT